MLNDKVIKNPKETIKDLINWLDWEWNDKYLSPQKNKRIVYTARLAYSKKKKLNQILQIIENMNA